MNQRDPTNPDPLTTPGLEPGGGVQPGDTPPAEASATEGLGGVHQPPPPRNGGPTLKVVGVIVFIVALLVVIGVVIATVVYG